MKRGGCAGARTPILLKHRVSTEWSLVLARLGPSEMSAISSLGDGKRTLRKPEEAGLNKLDL